MSRAHPDISTIVRSFPVAVARVGLHVLSPRAPELAARYAERLFTTARRHKRPEWEEAALASARREDVPHEGSFIPTWTWGAPDAPAVLLVHGWEGRGSQLAAFAPPLVEAGFRVVAFDAPGHGEAPTRRASVVEHARAVVTLGAWLGHVRGVVAHSVGGAGSLLATRFGFAAERFALVAPPIGPGRFVSGFANVFELDGQVKEAMIARIERHYGLDFDALDARRDARILESPLLVVHDRGDAVVAWSDGHSIAQAAPLGRLETTEGLGHRRILRTPAVVSTVTGFIGAGKPSFAESLDGELFFRERRRNGTDA